ncbi:MAG: hypothetical protein MUO43_14785, partial [Desulfobacterales bacterium]|nr:hypothetical protein [Desulfobacterales bacterium]
MESAIRALSIVIAIAVVIVPAPAYAASKEVQAQTNLAIKGQIPQAYSKLPVFFESCRNKATGEANFISRGTDYVLRLTPREAMLALGRSAPSSDGRPGGEAALLRMRLLGANRAPRMGGFNELPGKSNYLFGNDRAKWRTNVPHYGEVRYEGV